VISTQAPGDGDLLSTLVDDAARGEDPRTKLFLWAAPADADPWSPATWKRANPALGDFRSLEDVRDQAAKAKRLPALEAGFRNLILNQRISATTVFVPPALWAECGTTVPEHEYAGRPTFVGLDLGEKSDLTALVCATPLADGRIVCETHVFVPIEGLRDRAERDRVPYDSWAARGLLHTTPGPVTQYRTVAEFIAGLLATRNVVEVAMDAWRREVLVQQLEAIGCDLAVVDFRQGFQSMAPAVDILERLLLEAKLCHGNHPVLAWQSQNVTVERDAAGNRKFTKRKSTGRIDAMVALLMAVARSQQAPVTAAPAVWSL
jgi:phage terminase large subunit-like protein